MRHIAKICLLIMVAVLLHACQKDFLDLENRNQLSETSFYKNGDDAFKATIACYNRLKSWDLYGLNHFHMWNSWDDFGIFENANWQQAPSSYNSSQMGNIRRTYGSLSIGVYTCNVALKRLPLIESNDFPENTRKMYMREVSYLRAYYHFLFTLYFNQPPLVTEPIEDPAYIFKNATREQFYNQIISDLKFAIGEDEPEESLLPVEWGSSWVGRITRGQAMATLGKVYLYKASYAPDTNVSADYENAARYLKQCMDLNVYDLVMPNGNDSLDYLYAYMCNFTEKGFPGYPGENNIESVFEIQYGVNVTGGWESGYRSDGHRNNPYFAPNGWHNIAPTAKLRNLFEATTVNAPAQEAGFTYDPRRKATLYEDGDSIIFSNGNDPVKWEASKHLAGANEGVGWKKYFYPVGDIQNRSDGVENLRVIRYSHVLLMFAEAQFNLGNTTGEGLNALNYVRERVGMQAVATLSPQVIMHERAVEFALEGTRYHDLVRWSLRSPAWVDFTEVINASTKFKNDFEPSKHEFLPIPITEIDINGLTQNPGYN